ncbi:MAG TPA: ChbG/HpnK family deacetylase [Thermoanaerobaculia bacterium]|nr:ChbG/HpnK family deacetylase [Thermoanaerobaculia bacterium]
MKALVATADDVGLHAGLTRGALEAHDRGIVTAVSVVANGRALEPALEQLRDRPSLDAGIHLTLVGERPLSPPEQIPSLLGRDSAFLPDVRDFARRYLLGGIVASQAEAELRRQIEHLLASGLSLVHANSHQHLHVLPRIFEVVLRLAEEYRIPFVRIPREPAAIRLAKRSLEIAVLNAVGRGARQRLLSQEKVRTADRTVGVMDAGRLTFERLAAILEDVEDAEGVSELVCHPGIGNADLAAAYAWGYGWEEETAALCNPRLPDLLRSRTIGLTSFSSQLLPARP